MADGTAERRFDEWPSASATAEAQQPTSGPPPAILNPAAARPAERVTRQLPGIDAWNRPPPVRAATMMCAWPLEASRRLASLECAHDALLETVTRDLTLRPRPVDRRPAHPQGRRAHL